MSDQTPPVDEMQYERLAHEALRGVMRAALERVLAEGLPGAHHFYITFKTRAAGVSVAPDILAKYPDEMTVVLQHQYEDLRVEADRFSVKLRFGGMPKSLVIPYSAVTRFYDPSVQFLLQFEEPEIVEAVEETPAPSHDPSPVSDGPKVVSLDQFRKK
ncbi:Stringent starvation protein B [Brevundimonas sp. SH203]|uniref:SspB family protein n=1 Tax=Brevundimonas sp. SH203 TaxID=345167 RepID=UPI0009CDFC59|nr:ClpXP protease specificity-enhancing factor SspB [Brevundimonas sp. SH203]GAW39721.1 Stringent starvation protein B [Brevundimonas sp. SH203]